MKITAPDVVTTGQVWSFTMSDYALIDSFESYTTNFSSVWITGGSFQVDKAVDPIIKDPRPRPKTRHESTLCRHRHIDHAGIRTVQRATRLEFRSERRSSTSFWIRGRGNNTSLSNLYVQLSSTNAANTSYLSSKVSVPNFSSVVLDEDWQNINLRLSDFTNQGGSYSLGQVRRLLIGAACGAGGMNGWLWIDDIRLYPSRCTPHTEVTGKAGSDLGDITNDCTINYEDLYKVTDSWLDADSYVSSNGELTNCTFNSNSVQGRYNAADSGTYPNDKAIQLNSTGLDWVDIDDFVSKG